MDNLKDISALRRRGVPEKQRTIAEKSVGAARDTMNFTAYEGKRYKSERGSIEALPFCHRRVILIENSGF